MNSSKKGKKGLSLDGDKIRSLRRAQFYTIEGFAKKVGYSTRTIQRAEASERLEIATAKDITQALGLGKDIEQLLPEEEHERREEIREQKERVVNTVLYWLDHGWGVIDDDPLKGLPVSPEYQYRISKEWKGWNYFLGVKGDDPESKKAYDQNLRADEVEEIAFNFMMAIAIEVRKWLPSEF